MKIKKVTSWSLSALHLYEQCPLKYKFERLEGRKRTTSPALERGIDIHAKLENYLTDNIKSMPTELKLLSTEINNIKKYNPTVEEEFVFDNTWNQLKGNKAWFNKKAWLRGKSDIRVDNFLVDLKTGRHYPKYIEQAELYSLFTFIINPEMQEIDVEFWYSKTGDIISYSFTRDMIDSSKKMWNSRAKKLFEESKWLPTENEYCNWCEVKKSYKCPIFKENV